MSNKSYNWWKDPKNKKHIDEISWWNQDENKSTYPLPISVKEDEGIWVATFNSDTETLLGKRMHGVAQGDTREDAVRNMLDVIRCVYEHYEEMEMKYKRWVPFRGGNWKKMGGNWFTIFGIHFYLRIGAGMKGGWYIPFTKLNISISSEWRNYKNFKKQKTTT